MASMPPSRPSSSSDARNVEAHILGLVELDKEGLRTKGYSITSPDGDRERKGIVAFRHSSLGAAELDETLQRASVDVAVRRDVLRISPSYYNDADEIDRFLRASP